MMRAALAATVMVAVLPWSAAAQTAADPTQAPTPPLTQGPMTVERVHSGFMITPEVKATEFDRKAEGLVGGSVGWVADETFFIGGGGYWMPTDHSSSRRLAYGGAVLQWFVLKGDRFGLSAKALLGGGRATLPETVTLVVGMPAPRDLERPGVPQPINTRPIDTITTTLRSRQDFVVAEPEVNAQIAFAKHIRLSLGAGYRFAGSDWRNNGFDRRNDRISGAVGTIGIQIGG